MYAKSESERLKTFLQQMSNIPRYAYENRIHGKLSSERQSSLDLPFSKTDTPISCIFFQMLNTRRVVKKQN